MFITFEGVEGSGKSVQVGLLASKLREEGFSITVVREPGGTRIGEEIRSITHNQNNVDLTAVSEAYLMAGSRAQLVREMIKPSLQDNKIVIADRFIDSSLAYQGYGRELGEEVILNLNQLAIEGIMPDITFFLDVPPEIGIHRRSGSEKMDRLDLQQKDFYDRVYHGYKALAQKYPNRFITVNAGIPIDQIATNIWGILQPRLKK